MRRIDQGQDIRGVSLKLQEEERERRCVGCARARVRGARAHAALRCARVRVRVCVRRMDFVPEESALKVGDLHVDRDTKEMLTKLGYTFAVKIAEPRRQDPNRPRRAPGAPGAPGAPVGGAAAAPAPATSS
jgi:hypothetical protein